MGLHLIDTSKVVKKLLDEVNIENNWRGVIIVSGETKCGKTFFLTQLINELLSRRAEGHLLMTEDPVEIGQKTAGDKKLSDKTLVVPSTIQVNPGGKWLVTQRPRPVAVADLTSFFYNAKRQTPTITYVGELRTDRDIEDTIDFAQTGHLVLASLHSGNLTQTFTKLMKIYKADEHPARLSQLVDSLTAIVHLQPWTGYLINSPKFDVPAEFKEAWGFACKRASRKTGNMTLTLTLPRAYVSNRDQDKRLMSSGISALLPGMPGCYGSTEFIKEPYWVAEKRRNAPMRDQLKLMYKLLESIAFEQDIYQL